MRERFPLRLPLIACFLCWCPALAATPPALPAGTYTTESQEMYANKMYLSLWQEGGRSRVRLICTIPCLPNRKKKYRYSPEAYVGEITRAGRGNVRMRFEASIEKRPRPPAPFALRLHGGPRPCIEFGGGKNFIHAMSFQEFAYHGMGEYGRTAGMLFYPESGGGEFFLKLDGDNPRDAWLRFARGDSRAEKLESKNWRFVLGKSEHELAFFARLVGDLALPGGAAAEISVDVIRTPVSDVGLRLTRKGGPSARFWQANDSNSFQFTHCAPDPSGIGRCQVLLLGLTDQARACPGTEITGRLALLYDPAALTYDLLVDDGAGGLRNARCEVVFTWEMEEEFSRVILKDQAGRISTFTRKLE